MKLHTLARKIRKPTQKISSMFYTRWSPRAMTRERMLKKDLLPLFEAARWAPSSFNGQPWRFIIGIGKDKDKFLTFLNDWNKSWCKNASALIVILSRKKFEHKERPNPHHSFDTGSAWTSLALEGARRGLVVHGMAGIYENKIRKTLKISSKYKIEAMCAIGKLADKSVLPHDIAKDEVPSQRKKLNEIISWGKFNFK